MWVRRRPPPRHLTGGPSPHHPRSPSRCPGSRVPFEPEALLSDPRAIARICREDIPHQEPEFVDHIVPVSDTTTLDALDRALDDRLGRPVNGRISVSVPSGHHVAYAETTTYMTQINSPGALRSDDFDLG
ncbi:TIGR04141 family sporadically distributed protein [Streptomyces sp. PSKA30]|uniref:TIGR04141 family sporadically distributed protein n=1 Tax=Streptomyces sp. PSKA30 TaxID=2874597 RepID=UPI001CD0E918|nr:TIGR04141 family sporadically distributed protein [Streptomyces sp. PSKA30]MBZ9638969.1 TIGR04141 family sporadically distributed protein [Streptomyces sp. PSKA30]